MTDRPIIFSGPMVRALIDGRKTQTRRLAFVGKDNKPNPMLKWQAGDRLYVREAWGRCPECGYINPREGINKPSNCAACDEVVSKFGPSIHMPRSASRITLTLTEVRPAFLQEISDADAHAEGVEMVAGRNYRDGYAVLWNSLHREPWTEWDDDPEVVVLTFTVARGNIDAVSA